MMKQWGDKVKSQSVSFTPPPAFITCTEGKTSIPPSLHAPSCLYMTVTAGCMCVSVCVWLQFPQKALTMEDAPSHKTLFVKVCVWVDTSLATSSAVSILKCPPPQKKSLDRNTNRHLSCHFVKEPLLQTRKSRSLREVWRFTRTCTHTEHPLM